MDATCLLVRIARLAVLVICAVLTGCGGGSDCEALVARIHNSHIRWDGNYFGLSVRSMSEAEQRVLSAGSKCRSALIATLADDSRFVAAHVLLIQMDGGDLQGSSAANWNGLKVELHADGRVEIPIEQKTSIQKRWKPN